VARQTRQQRRARRAQAPESAPARTRAARPVAEPAHEAAPAPRRGHFLAESWAELQKVEWPRQQQVIAGTVVVLVACLVVGVYLWGADQIFKRLVEHVLLK
jgi:preprotein translocase subunit SecE